MRKYPESRADIEHRQTQIDRWQIVGLAAVTLIVLGGAGIIAALRAIL